MGNEQSGLPAEVEAACDELVRIPMMGKADSLNLAIRRQRDDLRSLARRRLQGRQPMSASDFQLLVSDDWSDYQLLD